MVERAIFQLRSIILLLKQHDFRLGAQPPEASHADGTEPSLGAVVRSRQIHVCLFLCLSVHAHSHQPFEAVQRGLNNKGSVVIGRESAVRVSWFETCSTISSGGPGGKSPNLSAKRRQLWSRAHSTDVRIK